MGNRNNDEIVIDVKKLAIALRRKMMIIMLVAVTLGLASIYFFATKQTILYTSTSKFYILNNSEVDPYYSSDEMDSAKKISEDVAKMVTSSYVLDEVRENLCLESMTYQDIEKCIAVNHPKDTRIIEVTVTFEEPQLAKDIVDEVVFVSVTRLPQLLRINAPKVFEKGSNPVMMPYKSKVIYGAIGCFLGGFLSAVTVILMELFDERLKGVSDLERNYEFKVLGTIPYRKKPLFIRRERTPK